MRLKIDIKSVLIGVAIGGGTLLLVAAEDRGPGQTFPRFQLSNQWNGTAPGDHGVYKIDTYTGDVTEIVGNKANAVVTR